MMSRGYLHNKQIMYTRSHIICVCRRVVCESVSSSDFYTHNEKKNCVLSDDQVCDRTTITLNSLRSLIDPKKKKSKTKNRDLI